MSSRETIQPHPGDKRQVDLGKSLSADHRSKAKKAVPKRQGDRGDQKRAPSQGK